MTAIIGVLCADGVVIGADSSATFGVGPQFKTIEQPVNKIEVFGDKIITAGTGEVGLTQRFNRIVDLAWKGNTFRVDDPVEIGRALCQKTLDDFTTTQTQKGRCGALLAFPVKKKFYLTEFGIENMLPELKTPPPGLWYTSMGSGQPITDPFLALLRRSLWPDTQPNVREGTFATLWALEHAIDCNAGGIKGPATLAVLQADAAGDLKARRLAEEDLAEHREAIKQAESGLRAALKALGSSPTADAIDVPKPGT